MTRAIARLVLLMCVIASNVATASNDSRIRIEQYSVNQGLVQNTINGLVEDADGFLWIATSGGLNRFDGHKFHVIAGPDDTFLNRYISALNRTPDDVLWIAIPNGGIYSLAPCDSQFTKRVDELLLDDWWFAEIIHIFVHQGQHYFIDEVALRQFNPDTGVVETLFEIEQVSESHYDLVRDAHPIERLILLATTQGVLAYNLDTHTVTPVPHVPAEAYDKAPRQTQVNAKSLYSHQGDLYVGAVQGLYRLDLNQLVNYVTSGFEPPTPQVLDPTLNVWEMFGHESDLLLATETGLYRHVFGSESVTNQLRFNHSDIAVFDDSIHHLHVDSDDNIWLGTWFNGLFYWRPQTLKFTNIDSGQTPFEGLTSNQIWTLAEDPLGRIWAGTQNGLNLLDSTQETPQHQAYFTAEDPSPYLHEGVVYDIFPDAHDHDTIWLYMAGYMYRFTPSTGEKVFIADLVDDEDERTILNEFFWGFNLIGDELWFADATAIYAFDTQTYQLQRYDTFGHDEFDLMNLYWVAGARSQNADQLFLSLASELWLFDRHSGTLQLLYRHEPFHLHADRYVESIVEDQQQRLWATLVGVGLVVLDANTLEHLFTLDQSDGLPTNYLYQGRVAQDGGLWFSSTNGLIHIHPETLHPQPFTYRDGVSSNEFNYTASTELADGRLAYGSMRGFTVFDPTDIHPPRPALQTRISGISDVTTGRRMLLPLRNLDQTHIRLPHDNRGIRIDVSTSSLERVQEVRYHYQLEGPETLALTDMRDSSFALPRLRPGHYVLSVQATDPNTGELTQPAQMSFGVAHPPWSGPLALALYSIAASALLIGFIYYRMRQHHRLRASKLELEYSEERLQLAVSATKSGIWDWHRDHDRLYETRVHDELGYPVQETASMTLGQYRQYIHKRDLQNLSEQWQALLSGEREEINCSYRVRDHQGQWVWFNDIGQVSSRDSDGLVERVTGVYQNITNARTNEEKVRLFGQAFEQTQDWVLILNSEQLPVTANRAFCEALGITELDLTDFNFVNLSEQRLHFYRDILKRMQPGEQWRGEEYAKLADGTQVPILVNISAVADPHSAHRAFVIVMTDISMQKEAEHQLRLLANYDDLTGLPNRTLLHERLDSLLEQPPTDGEQIAVLFIDLDRFKHINDSHGHNVGDSLLCVVAERLQSCVREQDVVARLGGDEFIVLLTAPSELAIESTVQRLIQVISEPIYVSKHHLRVSPSIGIAYFPQHGKTRIELLKNADMAMYEAKSHGRNCAKVFRLEMDAKVREHLHFEVELKDAVNRRQLQNYYQPIIDGKTQQCVGVEMLLRWQHNNQFISPETFIPLAEDLGLIVGITETALRHALADLKRLREIHPQLYLSVNLSMRHLDHDTLPTYVEALLQEFNLPAAALRFEITEGMLIDETQRAKFIMKQLRNNGILLMLDDFGTGYSSLRYLKEFPIDVIKIDKGFTFDIGRDRSDEVLIETILAMVKNLDKKCIAEGVETEAQQQWLLQRGCFLMQGYLYTPALKAHDIEAWLHAFEAEKQC